MIRTEMLPYSLRSLVSVLNTTICVIASMSLLPSEFDDKSENMEMDLVL
jgi:hypothetical protein